MTDRSLAESECLQPGGSAASFMETLMKALPCVGGIKEKLI